MSDILLALTCRHLPFRKVLLHIYKFYFYDRSRNVAIWGWNRFQQTCKTADAMVNQDSYLTQLHIKLC